MLGLESRGRAMVWGIRSLDYESGGGKEWGESRLFYSMSMHC